jgi:peptidoglycan/LPS O-acetylase OafA/YrhL
MQMLTFAPIFLTGALLYLYREVVPDSGIVALVSTALFAIGLALPLGESVPVFTFTSTALTAVFLVYPCLWLGIHLPFHSVGARNDYSYGVYIYAFPVQQMLVVWGVNHWGYWPYSFATLIAVAPLAVVSWWAVEKHALKMKKLNLRSLWGNSDPVGSKAS